MNDETYLSDLDDAPGAPAPARTTPKPMTEGQREFIDQLRAAWLSAENEYRSLTGSPARTVRWGPYPETFNEADKVIKRGIRSREAARKRLREQRKIAFERSARIGKMIKVATAAQAARALERPLTAAERWNDERLRADLAGPNRAYARIAELLLDSTVTVTDPEIRAAIFDDSVVRRNMIGGTPSAAFAASLAHYVREGDFPFTKANLDNIAAEREIREKTGRRVILTPRIP